MKTKRKERKRRKKKKRREKGTDQIRTGIKFVCSHFTRLILCSIFFFGKTAGRPPLGQIPFIITPEGKILGQSNAIAKFICKQGGKS